MAKKKRRVAPWRIPMAGVCKKTRVAAVIIQAVSPASGNPSGVSHRITGPPIVTYSTKHKKSQITTIQGSKQNKNSSKKKEGFPLFFPESQSPPLLPSKTTTEFLSDRLYIKIIRRKGQKGLSGEGSAEKIFPASRLGG